MRFLTTSICDKLTVCVDHDVELFLRIPYYLQVVLVPRLQQWIFYYLRVREY